MEGMVRGRHGCHFWTELLGWAVDTRSRLHLQAHTHIHTFGQRQPRSVQFIQRQGPPGPPHPLQI